MAEARSGGVSSGCEASGVAEFGGQCLLKASATKFSFPFTWRMSVVKLEMADSQRAWMGVTDSAFLQIANVIGLWSVKIVNSLPSRKYLKWRVEKWIATSSRS